MPLPSKILDKARFCLVSDLDWTMVDHNDATHEKLLRFNRLWLTRFGADSLLIFSTGRSPELFAELAGDTPLLTPDILVCSVGTEILVDGRPDAEWEAYLDAGGWDREQAAAVAGRFPELVLQRPSEQRPHKVSYKLCAAGDADLAAGVVGNLRAQLASAGLDATVVFSGGDDVDVLPARASKGKALAFLLDQIKESTGSLPPAGVLVAGDSGNDVELFAVPGVRACMVANAHAELREWCDANDGEEKQVMIFRANTDGPGGIREALYHFDLVRSSSSSSCGGGDGGKQEEDGGHVLDAGSVARRSAVVDLHVAFEKAFNAVSPVSSSHGDKAEDDNERADRDAVLEQISDVLVEDFEIVGPSGSLSTRDDLMKWLEERGWGSRAAAPTGSPRGGLLAAELLSEQGGGGGVGGGSDRAGEFRIWIDGYSEKELAPGLWLVRYKEAQQRFPVVGNGSGGGVSGGRTVRVSSAVLREEEGSGKYKWVYVHETWENTTNMSSSS